MQKINVGRTFSYNWKKIEVFFKILINKHTGKRPLGRPKRRWEDSIRMDLKAIGVNKKNWVGLAQNSSYWRALVYMCH